MLKFLPCSVDNDYVLSRVISCSFAKPRLRSSQVDYGVSNSGYTVKKIGHGLKHVKTNLGFFGLSLSFYCSF